jgi:3-phenylpropionate/trans-cinnamate dioxygenase ferredoxin subunit
MSASSAKHRDLMSDSFARIARVADIPEGSKTAFDVGGKAVLVCHTPERWYAVSNICSHAHEKLECGRLRRDSIVCPVHGARFDLATGKALTLPAKDPIAIFPVRIVDDWIEILV